MHSSSGSLVLAIKWKAKENVCIKPYCYLIFYKKKMLQPLLHIFPRSTTIYFSSGSHLTPT